MTRACIIEYAVTTNMPDGQPLPPFVDDAISHVVCHFSNQKTLWRRISLQTTQPSTAAAQLHGNFPSGRSE
jgi:hypothetical protein